MALSEETWKELRKLYESGKTPAECAREYGTSRPAVVYRIKRDAENGDPWIQETKRKKVFSYQKPLEKPKEKAKQVIDNTNVVSLFGGKQPQKITENKLDINQENKKEVVDIKQIASGHAEDAISVLVELMKDPNQIGTTRLMAADKILDRGFGKPTPFMDVGAEDDVAGESEEDRAKREDALKKALEQATAVKKKMLDRSKRLNK